MNDLSEKWNLRGVGNGFDTPCFVTGQKLNGVHQDMSGFVESKEAGERIVEMFNGHAFLDYRPSAPSRVQLKVGVSKGNERCLDLLQDLVRKNDHIITSDIVAASRIAPLIRSVEF